MRSTLQILCIGLAFVGQLIAAPESLVQSVTYSGETVTMRLNRENLRGANFELWSQNSTGGYDEVTPVAERSYLGTVDGYPGAVSCGVQLDDGTFKGAIYFDRGATWFTLGESVIETRALDYGNFTNFQYPASSTVRPGQAGTSIYAFDLGVDADHNYFADASSRVETAFERIEYSVAVTRAIYMRDTLLRPYLGRVIIRSSVEQDPYTGLTQGSYLDALRSHWNDNHQDADRDVVCGVSPSKIGGGLAWVGVIATSSAYSVNQSNGSGAFDVVFRHELGHNWNCGHFVGGSPEGTGLMGGNAPGRFSGCEAHNVLAHRDNRINSLNDEGIFTSTELPPYASMDAVGYTQTGGPQSIDVLANDHDANGQPISLESFDSTSRFGGSLSQVGNELVYTAPGSFIGTDSFTYKITDTAGMTATGAVTVNVQPGDPLRLYLPLDESAGNTAADFSVYQNVGSLNGTDFATVSTPGVFGNAPTFDGVDDSISISGVQLQSDQITLCGWIKSTGNQNGFSGIIFDRSGGASGLNFTEGNQLGYHWNNSYWWLNSGLVPAQDTWTFIALVVNGNSGATIHMNSGTGFSSWTNNTPHSSSGFNTVYVGRDPGNSSRHFKGAIDDVRVYNRALTEEELLEIMGGGRVEGPNPFDGATEVRNPEFSWSSTGNAESYQIYLGTDASSVANADSNSPEFIGETIERMKVVELMPNTTYYWRVDAVKPSDTTIGTVWSFSTANSVDEFGLVAHWKMDELDGNNIIDSTRNQYTGNLNGPTRSSGFEGGALTFDGVDDSVTFGSGPALAGKTDFTISAWVKTSASTDQVVIQQRNGGFNGQYQLRVRENGAVSFYVYGNLSTQFDFRTNLSVNDGQWHHIVAVRDGENGFIYVDGDPTPAASAIGTLRDLDSSIGVGIGRDIRDNIRPFNGQIDEVKIYNLAKSGTEIQRAYNQYLNQAPSWNSEPLTITDAIEGVLYTANLNDSATDPNGDPLSYSYLNGPSWLSISPNGELSGTPSREDVGQQSWTVSASDGFNPAVETIIYLTVLADTDGDAIPDSIDLDDDNDEIPDAWENQYGLNPQVADANDNPDGDRYSNVMEYLFDTNPLDASSEPLLRVEASDAPGSLQLRYQSSAERIYTLEASPNLENGIWQRFTQPSPGTGEEIAVPLTPSNEKHFFRLRVELPQ